MMMVAWDFVMEQAISLEQTNALRKSLGLRPITLDNKNDSVYTKTCTKSEKDAENTDAAVSTRAKLEAMENRIRHHKATKVEPKRASMNWLESIKSKKAMEEEAASNPRSDPVPNPEVDEGLQPQANVNTTTKTKKLRTQLEAYPIQIATDTFESTFDPLNKEDRPINLSISDFKKVKFKTKKRKSLNKRVIYQEDYELSPMFSIDDEEEDLCQILAQNRMNQLKCHAPEEIAKLVKEESTHDIPPKKGIVVSSTTDFLLSMRKRTEEPAPSVAPAPAEPVIEKPEEPAVIEEKGHEDDLVSNGLAATLSLLKSRGVVKTENARKTRKNKEWLQKVTTQRLQRDFELRQQKESIDHLPSKKRSEYLEIQDKQNAKEELELAKRQFKDYQPIVDIEHRDDQGILLDPKQAFKHLSHKFHGNFEGRKRALKRKSHADSTEEEMAKPLFNPIA